MNTPVPIRPPVGAYVVPYGYPETVLVTEHTARGFKYSGANRICIPRLGIHGDGTGEFFLDVEGASWRLVSTPTAPDLPAELKERLARVIDQRLTDDRFNFNIKEMLLTDVLALLPAPIPVTAPLPASEGTQAVCPHCHQVERDARKMGTELCMALQENAALGADKNMLLLERKGDLDVIAALREQTDSLRTLLATAQSELSVHKNQSVVRDETHAAQLATAEKERDEAKRQCAEAMSDYDRVALTNAELRVDLNRARLTPSASQSAEMEKRVEECEKEIRSHYNLQAQGPWVGERERLSVILRRHFTTPTQ